MLNGILQGLDNALPMRAGLPQNDYAEQYQRCDGDVAGQLIANVFLFCGRRLYCFVLAETDIADTKITPIGQILCPMGVNSCLQLTDSHPFQGIPAQIEWPACHAHR